MPRLPLSRRTCLRGAGVALALPWLEAMSPLGRRGRAGTIAKPLRFCAISVPHGVHMPSWTPSAAGTNFTLPPILAPLAPYQSSLNVLTGLENYPASITTEEFAGAHARGTGAMLTSRRMAFTADFSEITNGISLDQVLASALASETALPSLELGISGGSLTGDCEDGYSCAYLHNISWYGPGEPAPKETDPRALFQRLAGVHQPDEGGLDLRALYDTSILDRVMSDAETLHAKLGARDRAKLDEYLDAVREVERRIQDAPGGIQCGELPPEPEDPATYQEHVRAMLDLVALAFRCDLTRVVTFMMENPFSSRSFEFLGIGDDHHYLSHHGGDPDKLAAIETINVWQSEQVAYLLARLQEAEDGDGTLLDSSIVWYSSEFGDGDDHYHDHLPMVVAGRAGGAWKGGQHLVLPDPTPIANLGLTILQTMGLPDTEFGEDGTAPITELLV